MDSASFFILNIFFNSLLAFFTSVLLVKSLLFLFQIQHGRTRALLEMIPIFKLPFDLLLYDFTKWSYMQNINPLSFEKGARSLSIFIELSPLTERLFPFHSGVQFTLPGNTTFTIADLIGYTFNPYLNVFSLILIFLCLSSFLKTLVVYYRGKKTLQSITKKADLFTKKIDNPYLLQEMQKRSCRILHASSVHSSPFVAGLFSPIIYIPSHLLFFLSTKEYEAALSHEIEHIRYKDGLIRFLLEIIASIFWWVPTKWLRDKILENQEISCDCNCKRYGVDATDLASAIYQSAAHTKRLHPSIFASHLTAKKTLKRVHMLLHPLTNRWKKLHGICSFCAIILAYILIFLGRFWVF